MNNIFQFLEQKVLILLDFTQNQVNMQDYYYFSTIYSRGDFATQIFEYFEYYFYDFLLRKSRRKKKELLFLKRSNG